MKKKLAVIIVLTVTLMLSITACTTDQTAATQQPAQSAASTQTAKTDTTPVATPPVTASPPTEITMFFCEAGQNFPEGFDHADNYYINRICELANVTITSLNVPAFSDTATKFNLMMSSGDIPDLVERADPTSMKQYGMEGAFLPTEEVIRNSGVLSQVYNDVEIEAMKSSDGVAYVILNQPLVDDYECLAVRQDLLDDLGLDMPATTDEFIDACRALKEKYPESVPIVVRGAVWGYMDPLFASFDVGTSGTGWVYDYNTGMVRNTFEGDNIVDAVTFSKLLYDEKLLDPEFITTTTNDYMSKIVDANNKVLFYGRNWGSICIYMQQYISTGQYDAVVVPMAFPAADGYESYHQATPAVGPYAFGINSKLSSDQDTLDGVIRWLETLYSDEVKQMAVYGQEGVDYSMVDGSPSPIYPAAVDDSYRSLYGWMFVNSKDMINYLVKSDIEASTISDSAKQEYENQFYDADTQARGVIMGAIGYDPIKLASPLSDELINKANECIEKQKSLLAEVIVGEITLDDFKTQKEALAEEYQAVTDAYNAAAQQATEKYGLDQKGFQK